MKLVHLSLIAITALSLNAAEHAHLKLAKERLLQS